MNDRNQWRRVCRNRPCPICERPDWCLVAADDSAAICARTESPKRCGKAGWLHRLRDDGWRQLRRRVRSVALGMAGRLPDLAELASNYRAAVDPAQLDMLARALGLTVNALTALSIGWSTQYHAWSFPMSDATGAILGIRLRRSNAHKFAVPGGREGLILPSEMPDTTEPRLLVCEGPTDTAALLDLGYTSIVGRPSCTGGGKLLVVLVQQRHPDEVVILGDGDEPGQRGADNLASVLQCYVPIVRVVIPKRFKDVREFVRAGGTRKQLDDAISAAPVRRLAVRAVAAGRGTP